MIGVTGATGHLGRLAVEKLLARGIAASEIVAVVRSPEKAADLAEKGVQLREASYDDPGSLSAAFAGLERLLFVSGNEMGSRVVQHGHVVDAARSAGVGLVAYTSIVNADTNGIRIADEHRATERLILEAGIPYVLLRNSWYVENYTAAVPAYIEHGVVTGSAGEGKVSAATREEYAEAAATVVSEPGHENHIYELGGEPAFTMAEFATALAELSGRPVTYRDLPVEQYAQFLQDTGVPESYARLLADADAGVARGELFTDSGDLGRLLGRKPTPYREVLARVIRGPAARS